MVPSSPDQAAFHEGFSDVVALLSVFSLPGVVAKVLDLNAPGNRLISEARLTIGALKKSVLVGLAEEMGAGLSSGRQRALRRSARLKPGRPYMSMPEYEEEHDAVSCSSPPS